MAKKSRRQTTSSDVDDDGMVPVPPEVEFYEVPPVPPEVEAPLPPPPPPPAPVVQKAVVPFRVFAQVSPLKWDQLAGFKSYVKRTNLGPMSMTEWQEAFAKFMGTPI